MKTNETLTKASRSAIFLCSELRSAQKEACEANPILELHLRELLGEAQSLRIRINATLAAVNESNP